MHFLQLFRSKRLRSYTELAGPKSTCFNDFWQAYLSKQAGVESALYRRDAPEKLVVAITQPKTLGMAART